MTDTKQRLTRLRLALVDQEVDALVIHQGENRRYVTGFSGTAGLPIVTASEALLLADTRYDERARREAPGFTVQRVEGRMIDCLSRALADLGVHRVGFEADTVTVSELDELKETTPDIEWVATSGIVERLRAIKSAAEIASIRAAVKLTDAAMDHAYDIARPGLTETALTWQIELFMRENGAEAVAFDIIVAAGENGALPHHQPGERPIQVGDPIVIDLGARVGGYCGDLTRTFCLGPARDAGYGEVYEVVAAANRKAIEGLRPGMTGVEVDALARDVIGAAGFGDNFGHGLGHGVGLQVHELPRLSPMAGDTPLAVGMVMTIEPGIYLNGRFGVRIEDLIVMGETGAEVLSQCRQAMVIPES
jgi:Xaa-Pro aminopeptidase